MRIAFLVHRFPAISETFILRQITGLIDLGHEVDIYSERSPNEDEPVHPEFEQYELRERTTYLDVEMPAESGHWSMPIHPIWGKTWLPGEEKSVRNAVRVLRAMPTFLRSFAAAPALTMEVLQPSAYSEQARTLEALYNLSSLSGRARQYDVIHAHFGPVANNLRFARHVWKAPLVVTFHGYDYCSVPREQGRHIYDRLFRDADAVVAISDYALTKLEELGCPTEKIRVLHTGVRLSDFPYRPRTLVEGETVRILAVGRLVEKKGFEFAIRAIALVRRKYPNLRYDIIGDGPLRTALQQLIRELGLEEVVSLLGTADSDFIREKMAQAHLFLLASVTASDADQEGIPVSLMEAQAAGLPVLSTTHSGIPELIADGVSGTLVPERDIEALAGRLLNLIEHSLEWPRMGREGRQIVEERFNITALNDDLAQLYREVCANFAGQKKCTPATSTK
jgi:colanic acid/amylovoran biosynthesis glycosyltransferase